MKTYIFPLFAILSLSMVGCGRKVAPKPPSGVEVIYPSNYPAPNCPSSAKQKKKSAFQTRKKKSKKSPNK